MDVAVALRVNYALMTHNSPMMLLGVCHAPYGFYEALIRDIKRVWQARSPRSKSSTLGCLLQFLLLSFCLS